MVSGFEYHIYKPANSLVIKDDTIIMEDENFTSWIQELYGNLGRYEGKKNEVVGFVLKDNQFSQNEFVPARFTMNCCAADMQPVGILCNYGGAVQLKKDSWVKVAGRVQEGEFDGQKISVIVAETVKTANKPENELVY